MGSLPWIDLARGRCLAGPFGPHHNELRGRQGSVTLRSLDGGPNRQRRVRPFTALITGPPAPVPVAAGASAKPAPRAAVKRGRLMTGTDNDVLRRAVSRVLQHHDYSGRPALRRPLANVAKSIGPAKQSPNPADWWRANRGHIRLLVTSLLVLCQVARPAHCWLRTCIWRAGNSDYRAASFRRMTTPCHIGPRENGHTPWLRACRTWTDRAGSGAWHAQRAQVPGPAHLSRPSTTR